MANEISIAGRRPISLMLESHEVTLAGSPTTVLVTSSPRELAALVPQASIALSPIGQAGPTGPPGSVSGAVNDNTGGVGVVKNEVFGILHFYGIGPGSNKITVTLDVANDRINIDVAEANLVLTASQISDFAAAADIRVLAGIAAHLADPDPHPQYLTPAEGDTLFLTLAEGNATYSLLGHTHLLASITDVTMTVANLNALDDGLNTALHFHDADRARANHTGSQLLATISDVTVTPANLNALDDGVNTALHFHDADRARANHTGSQAAATISDFSEAVDDRVAALCIAGSNMTITYDDALGTLTFTAAGGGGGAGADPGDLKMIAHSTLPTGWLFCDGAAVSRATYAALFAAISTAWGAGDGSTTFNLPDFRGRVPVGAGTGTVVETQAAANFATTDIITVDSNPMDTKPKWLTGMKVQVTTSGVLPTGIAAATDHYVRRLSATTISLYDTLAHAMNRNLTTGIRNITATGSGNHTLTCTMAARTLGDLFGAELTADVPSHSHLPLAGSGTFFNSGSTDEVNLSSNNTDTALAATTASFGDTNGITNMPPSAVVNYIIKT